MGIASSYPNARQPERCPFPTRGPASVGQRSSAVKSKPRLLSFERVTSMQPWTRLSCLRVAADTSAYDSARCQSASRELARRSGSARCGGSKWWRSGNVSRVKSGKIAVSRFAI